MCEVGNCPLQVCEVGNCPLQVCEAGNCPLQVCEVDNCPLQVCEVGNCPLQVCEEGNCPLSLAGARTGVGAGPDQAGLGGVGVQEAGPHPPAQRRPDGDPGLQEHLVPQDHQLHPRGGQRQEGPQGIEQQSVKVGMIASPRPLLLFCTVTPITSCKKRRPTVRERMVLRTSESLCLF